MAKKILIIDDDPLVVKLLKNIFEDNGYETCSAENGVEGAEVVKTFKPDMITLDLEMPKEWGPRFYRKLVKDNEYKDIPVIVISGLSSIKHSIRNIVGYLGKPFEADEVLALTKKALGEPDDS
ncbi:MAG: response regulator [Desulfobacterales bacterium]|nr:response regulator [Desulfobacterales bacterium]